MEIDLNSNELSPIPEIEQLRRCADWGRCDMTPYYQRHEECTKEHPTCRIHVVKARIERLLKELLW